jgi:uracil-DNA glycosylase
MDRDTVMRMFDRIDANYKQILVRDNKALLSPILSTLDTDIKAGASITPEPQHIFRAFKLTNYANTRVVIIGQDPFIRPNQATGLSFSVPPTMTIPPSTRKIYECLIHHKLIADNPTHGCLDEWARQGVLMLNAALTTKMGESNAHKFWHKYTDKIIADLSRAKDFLIVVLWGDFAHKKAQLIDDKHLVLKWGHPSPLNSANKSPNNVNNFMYCDSFTKINEALVARGMKAINWDPRGDNVGVATGVVATVAKLQQPQPQQQPQPSRAFIFTDGGATANGKVNCKASWGCHIVKIGALAGTESMGGIVPPINISGKKFAASNNRGEITALVKAIEWVGATSYPHDIEIVSDSKYLIDCLTKWIAGWIRAGKLEEKKNTDLLLPLYHAIQALPNKITYKHVNSHRAEPPKGTPEYFYWCGNDAADKICSKQLYS